MKNQAVYEAKYGELNSALPFLVKAVSEEAGSTVNAVAANSGEDGVQALFDALMDNGHRSVLVAALNSPSMNGWVKEKLELFLYGQRKQTPVLFAHLH